jgi:hypothetical protein
MLIKKMDWGLDLGGLLEICKTVHPGVMVDIRVYIFMHGIMKMG